MSPQYPSSLAPDHTATRLAARCIELLVVFLRSAFSGSSDVSVIPVLLSSGPTGNAIWMLRSDPPRVQCLIGGRLYSSSESAHAHGPHKSEAQRLDGTGGKRHES